MIEPKLNEVFEFNGKKLKCITIDNGGCFNCYFTRRCLKLDMNCLACDREDGISVMFKEINNKDLIK